MAGAASVAKAFFVYPISNHLLKPYHQQQKLHSHIWLPAFSVLKRRGLYSSSSSSSSSSSPAVVSCLIPGVDGGGVSDDFVSTRKSGFSREFAVIANMLKRIEPLDTSVISKGVSDSAKDSMKQTISSMLGLLPSDQFSITVRFSKGPLYHLIVSSIITGYTLWNAEYRISLIRNFDLPLDITSRSENGISEINHEDNGVSGGESNPANCADDVQILSREDLSPKVLNYIQQLESELSTVKQELLARKQENAQMELAKESNNDLLEYLRSLESDMVAELSTPSSPEVEEVIHQLGDNILLGLVRDGVSSTDIIPESCPVGVENPNFVDDRFDTIGTSRDYLAKLLFWCMLLGHHLRGLENRLHLSCAVGLL